MDFMGKRDFSDAPAAVLEWRDREAKLLEDAKAWARVYIDRFVANDESYTPWTAGELLKVLDKEPEQPSAWGRLNLAGTHTYNTRFNIVRNHLETMAKHKLVIRGTTINRNGVEGVATYSRPKDVLSLWDINVECATEHQRESILVDLRDYFSTRGTLLDGAQRIVLNRKQRSGGITSAPTVETKSGTQAKRRKSRTTRGGD